MDSGIEGLLLLLPLLAALLALPRLERKVFARGASS